MNQKILPPTRNITKDEWIAEGTRLFGDDMTQWKFVCPNCGGVQTGQDFRDRGIEPKGKVYFSCIGRFYSYGETGTISNPVSPCDYTLGGLVVFSSKFVEGSPVFEYYTEDKPAGNA